MEGDKFLTVIKKKRKLVGRGDKTAGRGTKGQKSRKSGQTRVGFEGGQNPFYIRFPKKGFKSKKKDNFVIVNIKTIEIDENIKNNSKIDFSKNNNTKVKILGKGNLTKKLEIKAHSISRGAEQKIIEMGGSYTKIT